MTHPQRFVSLRTMLELNARAFLGAATEMRAIQIVIGNFEHKDTAVNDSDKRGVLDHLSRLKEALDVVGANLALKSAERLRMALEDEAQSISLASVAQVLADIESRFGDHLEDISVFVISDEKVKYLKDDSISANIWIYFSSATFEMEEAAKCIALARYTASVFHCMRVLEIGIRSLSRFLKIDDPTKPAERNWAFILGQIRDAVDALKKSRNADDKKRGEALEGVHATLDAIRNPWRNATMHVENVYAPHDAVHIFNCVEYFMDTLAQHCDEDGNETI